MSIFLHKKVRYSSKVVEWIKKGGQRRKNPYNAKCDNITSYKILKTLKTLKAGQGFSEAVADTEA